MATPSLPHAKDRAESTERAQPLRSPSPSAEGFASPLLDLQRTAGNQAIGHLLRGSLLQAKLRIGSPGDAYEREADRVAEAVLGEDSTPISVSAIQGAGIQRMCAECEEEMLQRSGSAGDGLVQRQCHCQDEELVQRKCHCQEEEALVQTKADAGPAQSTPGFATRVEALRGSGRPLSADIRSFFEPRFGHDFGAVRVHTGAASSEAARSVNARAFTVGNDVVFEAGEWSPETAAGKRLLAHELTHVVQQAPLVARRKPLLQRAPEEGGEPSPQAEGEPAVSPEQTSQVAEEPAAESPAAEGEPAAALVVDDEAETVGPGQMKKGEFFARLRAEVCAAAEAGLAGTEHSARACPLIEFWLGYYEGQGVERINRDLPRFAGEGPRPTTAEGYIALIADRVRASVATWARTGEITGVPRGLPLPGMGLPGLGSLGGLFGGLGGLGGFGSVLFKARPGGARDPGDPVTLQARLGAGRPLESSLRSRMESAFGRSFSHVRVHTDSSAAGLSAGFNARAFTVGHHVAFGPREYRPGTMIGDALIAHELAHVAQQGDAGAAGPIRAEGAAYQALERDADLATAGAVASMWTGLRGRLRSFPRPQPRLSSGLRLQRCDRCSSCSRQQTAPPVAAPTRPTTPTPPAPCQPTPESYQTIFADTQEAGLLGYTKLDPASELICAPQIVSGSTPGTCAFTPRPLRLAFISKHVRKGDHPSGETVQIPGCPGPTPIVFRVSEEVERLAVKGEQEHCGDLKVAYDRTLKPCGEALSRLVGTPLAGQNEGQCFADLVQKLGFDPISCTEEFLRLTQDQRDAQDWHAFDTYVISRSCQEAVAGFRPAAENRIGDESVRPETLVPQATGCSPAASTPVPTTPTPTPTPQTPPQPGRARFTLEIPQESNDDDAFDR